MYIPGYISKKNEIESILNRLSRAEKQIKTETLLQKKFPALGNRKIFEQLGEFFIISPDKNIMYSFNHKKKMTVSEKIKSLIAKADSSKKGIEYVYSSSRNGKGSFEIVKRLSKDKYVYIKAFEHPSPFTRMRWYYLLFFILFVTIGLSGIAYIIHSGVNSISETSQIQEKEFNDRIQEWQLLSAGVAHEIKNPLSSLSMFSELISRNAGDNEQIKEYLSYIFKEIERLNTIVSNFLSFSKPPEIDMNKYDISSVISEVIKQFDKPDIHISLKQNGKILPFYFDSSKIKQVLINIFKNSIEACKDLEKISIDVSINSSNRFINITIVDNGPGLSAEKDRVLQPFYTTKAQGSGLGLSISYQIIRSHKGIMSIKDHTDKGCEVSIQLPYRKVGR